MLSPGWARRGLLCLGAVDAGWTGWMVGRRGRGTATGAEGVVRMGGAGVMGLNREEGAWEGEVGSENAVKGMVGGSKGDTGIGDGRGPGSGREGFLSLGAWLEMK